MKSKCQKKKVFCLCVQEMFVFLIFELNKKIQICRSPMAEIVMRKLVKENNQEDNWIIDSAGTAAYHIGEEPDERTIECCKKNFGKDYPKYNYRARQFTSQDFEKFDYM